jgi:hypothetical protein
LVRGTRNNLLNFKSGFQITVCKSNENLLSGILPKIIWIIIHPQDFMKQVLDEFGFLNNLFHG